MPLIRAIDQPGCEECEALLEWAGRDSVGACAECTADALNLGDAFFTEFWAPKNVARSKDQRNE